MKNLNLFVVLSVLIFTNVAHAEDKKDSKSGPTSPSDVLKVSAPIGLAGVLGSFKLADTALSYNGDMHFREELRSGKLFNPYRDKKVQDVIANLKQNPLKKGEAIEISYSSATGPRVKSYFKYSDSIKTIEEFLTRKGAKSIEEVKFFSADRWKSKLLNGATDASAAIGSVASLVSVAMALVPEHQVSQYRDSARNPQSSQAMTKAISTSAPASSGAAAEAKSVLASKAD